MHISEGYLSGPILISGAVLAAAGTAVGLKRLDYDQIAQGGILASTFFVTSLVHVPIGPSNAHLIMNGIIGLLLGWSACPVILAALVLQAVFFQFGGITTLGVNEIIMAAPAVAVYYLFGPWISRSGWVGMAAAFAGGALAVAFSAIVMALCLFFTDENFLAVAVAAILVHLPVMIIEGVVSAFCVGFLKKVKPEMLPRTPGEQTSVFDHSPLS
ncbi:MAG: cobalt transporter CbiM [Desulfobacteraceae bacterium]|nr:MAG: cobalt transporter CbiM [Desulfobacteraceae bacterium]